MAVLRRLRVAAQPFMATLSRPFGSAALLDYDYYEEEKGNINGTMEESEGWVTRRGVQWVIIGDPMAKRHVYAEKLSKLLDVPYISMATLVRQELHPRSSLYKQIATAVNEGKLVPEDVIFGLLSKRLEEGHCRGENGFILDGIPRTRVQAEILDQIADIDLVVNLKCSEERLWKKCLGDGISSAAQGFFGLGSSGFNLGLESQDGNPKSSGAGIHAIWKEKLKTHAEQNKPLESYYRKQHKLLNFQVGGAPGETWRGLLAALHLQHINASYSSQKLTA